MHRSSPLLLVLLGASITAAEPTPPPRALQNVPLRSGAVREGGEVPFRSDRTPRSIELGVKVEKIWAEGSATFANVAIRNTSSFEIEQVDLHCTALDRAGKELSHHDETIRPTSVEPMKPGSSRTVKLTVETGTQALAEMSCSAVAF